VQRKNFFSLTTKNVTWWSPYHYIASGQWRWTESEKLTPKTDSKTKTPNPIRLQILDSGPDSVTTSAILLHNFYIHHTIHTESGFSQKLNSGSEKCSRIRLRAHLCWTVDTVRICSLYTCSKNDVFRQSKTLRYYRVRITARKYVFGQTYFRASVVYPWTLDTLFHTKEQSQWWRWVIIDFDVDSALI